MKLKFLGTGAAEGIPNFGCTCVRCQLARKEKGPNSRRRASLLVEAADQRLLLDVPPEISQQLNHAEVYDLTAILLSHEHHDHIGGLIEFEFWQQVLPVFAGYDVLTKLLLTPRFKKRALLSGFQAQTRLHFGDLTVMPFKVIHHVSCYGFVIESEGARLVHFTDSDFKLSNLHRSLIRDADVVIFHTPTYEEHRHHLSVKNVIALAKDWSLKQTVITHINHHNLSHEELEEKLAPEGIIVAYDGLVLEI